MGVMQYIVAVLMLSAHSGLTSPVDTQIAQYYTEGGRTCLKCPPGQYQKSCIECEPCGDGTYTSDWNTESVCHYCFRGCRADLHLRIVQNCSKTTNIRCRCEAGFECTQSEPKSNNCKNCVKSSETTTPAVTLRQTPAFTVHSSTSSKPCSLPNCGSQRLAPEGNATDVSKDMKSRELAAILCPVVAIGCCIALLVLFCTRGRGNETCFKLAIVKLCNEGGRDASSHKTKESTQQFPRYASTTKHQPLPLANLGPVHVHNPGTVIFSLLSQFTGQADPTREEDRTEKRVSSEEVEERDCPVFHPTPSPCIHLSEEERSGEAERVFFPSQEQGKDCHISKEEGI
ncbi:uncharacterized protein LOC115374249 isoform X2 [Myripristis murdjan]|uniref:uncharacterized protein LOC115374249 isoform X2 n=1 Tax=Myripristis murdjan TaxID=586833 RepID=UPI0011763618|nr:uncharacterized protein LOC115374249 isoform X2 [Myripristis murdjan]